MPAVPPGTTTRWVPGSHETAGPFNVYAKEALVTLALADPRQAARLAVEARSLEADEALEELVRAMVEAAEEAGRDAEQDR